MTNSNISSTRELSASELDQVSGGLIFQLGGVKAAGGNGNAGFSVGGVGLMVSEGGHAVTLFFGSHKVKLHD